jgi:putative acetyltransferase
MHIAIVPTAEAHFDGLYEALDIVAREKRFLAFIQAPPREESFAFYRGILQGGHCQFVALRNGRVVGWCDVLPTHGEARAHIGILGIGLIPNARRIGIGTLLMQASIDSAWKRGISRIELTVRTDNSNAAFLYERFGFIREGLQRRAFCVDGEFFDCYALALVR